MKNPIEFCANCLKIRWCSLPSEEQDGAPHHLNLEALEKSAETCALCTLIIWAGGCSLGGVGGMISMTSGIELPSGIKVMASEIGSNYNSMGMRALENGAAMLDFSSPQPDYRPPVCRDPRDNLPEGTLSQIRPWLFGSWWKSLQSQLPLQLIGLGVRYGTTARIEDAAQLESDKRRDNDINFRGTFLRVRVDPSKNHYHSIVAKFPLTFAPESPAAEWMIPGYVRQADSGSSIAIERLKNWLEFCDKHDDCVPRNVLKPLPTRVLEVVPNRYLVSLRETKGQRGKYIALSHCWGQTHRLTLTRSNLSFLMDGIALQKLPQTFRDCLRLAKQLDIRYVWIDSLCIIQDDAADWEEEAARMGSVYAQSYLTVAALSSTDDSSGCFPDPETRYKEPFVSSDVRSTGRRCFSHAAPSITYAMHDGELGPMFSSQNQFAMKELGDNDTRIYITPEWMPSSRKSCPKTYHVGAFGGKFDPIADEALSKRAWTLQERLLAPRTIHYGRTEMYWECQNIMRAEDGAYFARTFTRLKDLVNSESSHRDPWFQLIEDYTSRNLTRDEDKLPALSGLASLIARENGDEYFAGIWKKHFIKGLNWSIESYNPSHHCDDPDHDASMPPATKSIAKRPSSYRAPSWSWASLDAKVSFGYLEKAVASCVEVKVTLAGADPFGKIGSGYARIKVG